MPDQRYVTLFLTGTKEQREDRWAIYCNDLGFIAYGRTEAEAEKDFEEAAEVLIASFKGDEDGMRKWLDVKGVKYRFGTESRPLSPYTTSLEVAVAATA